MNKRSILVFFGMIVLVILHSFVVQAADRAYFSASKMTFLIGEPVQLVFHVSVPQNAQLILPDFASNLSPFMVKSVGSLNLVQQVDGLNIEYTLPLEVVLWRTGKYETSVFTVSYQLAGEAPVYLTVESLQFEVSSVLNDNDLAMRPFKPLVNLPYFPIWEILPVVMLIAGVVVILSRKRFTQIRKQTSQLNNSTITGHPEVVKALKTLRQIQESNASPLVKYVQVSDCLRYYLSKRFSVPVLDLTTSELSEELNERSILNEDHQQKLIEILKRADLVKFANVIPKQSAARQYISLATQWIHAVEQASVELFS